MIEHRLEVENTMTVHDKSGEVLDERKQELSDAQVVALREGCDECFSETHCEEGEECALYLDRVFRGGDAA